MIRRWHRFLSSILMTIGLGWVVYLFAYSIENSVVLLPENWQWLILATLFLTASLATNVLIFHFFLNMQTPVPLISSAKLHLVGQLLRYLPGRVWGVVYQISVTRDSLSAPNIIRANLDVMAFMLLGSILVVSIVAGNKLGWPIWLLSLTASSIVLSVAVLFSGSANKILKIAASRFTYKIANLLSALAQTKFDIFALIKVFICFFGGWTFYFLAWSLIGMAYPIYANVDFIFLCSIYTLASIIGIVSAITPAGLGVRELAFIVLASSSAQNDVIAFLAIFGRIWLLFTEIMIITIFFGFLFLAGNEK